MSTATLNSSNLLFSTAGGADESKLQSFSTHFAFAGPAGAARSVRGIAAPTTGDGAANRTYVDAADATATAARAVLTADLAAETTARTGADATHTTAIAANSAGLTQEATDRTAGDAAEATARTAAIAVETAARVAADATHTAGVAANAAATAQETTDRQAAVTSEAGTRASADTVLTNNLAQEVTDRAAGDSAETAARTAAISGEASTRAAAIAAASVADRSYADGILSSYSAGVHWKDSCRVVAGAALPASTFAGTTITGSANGALTVDGVALAAGDRLLVTKEVDKKSRGIYDVTTAGDGSNPFVLTRSSDADTADDFVGQATFIREGATGSDQAWILTSDGATPGVSDIDYSVFSTIGEFSAGSGINITAKVISIPASGVATSMLADDSCTADKLADGCIDDISKMGSDTVDTSQMVDGACTDAKCDFTHVQSVQATFTGNCTAQAFVSNSDERLKQHVKPHDDDQMLNRLCEVETFEYEFKTSPGVKRHGVIAQRLAEQMPELVREDSDKMLSVCYQDLIPALLSAVKSLSARYEQLEELYASMQ
jgi:hypothetical protein